MYSIVTVDPLISPAGAQDLIDWARLDSDDPKIGASLLIATKLVTTFLSLEILPRTYTLTYEDWPIVGTVAGRGLSPVNYANKTRVDLPYANAISITSVSVNGELLTTDDYRLIKGRPDQIQFKTIGYNDIDSTAIEIVYVAGYGLTSASVPAPIIQAITMVAGYIHAHAGACNMGNAVRSSGASELLTPYAVMAGLAF